MTTFTTEDRVAVEQGTPEWHELRRGKVTASRVADILAKTKTGPSASRQNYLIELALQRITKTIEPSYTNAAMEWGTQTEPQARVAYEVATHNFVDQVAFIDHPTIEGFGCSPDGIVGEGLIEIKCPNSLTHVEYILAGKPPAKYIPQMAWQLACTGRKWVDFVSYDDRLEDESKHLFIVRYERDDEYIAEMEEAVKKFLDEVEAKVQKFKSI